MMMRAFLLLAVCACLVCCTSTNITHTLPMNGTFTLGPGESARVGGEYVVRFDSVAEDSRCPEGVECVWAGNAAVMLTVDWSSPHRLRFDTEPTKARSAVVGRLVIQLDSLSPRSRPDDPATYVVTLSTHDAENR
jgi:hypothetical protein